jgi:hypothetical protein
MAQERDLKPEKPERMTERVDLGRSGDLIGEGQTDQVASSRIQPATQVHPGDVDPKNPLGEPMVKVRVRPGVETFWDGEKVRGGDEFETTISKARAGSMFVDEIQADGSVRPIQHEQQRPAAGVPMAQLAGFARHERIGALEEEEKALRARLEALSKQLEHEREGEKQDQARRDAESKENAGAAGGPSFAPGTPGAPATQSTPPRTGEIPGQDVNKPNKEFSQGPKR